MSRGRRNAFLFLCSSIRHYWTFSDFFGIIYVAQKIKREVDNMKKTLQLAEYQSHCGGEYHVQYDDLVGTGLNWIAPARVLGMDLVTFLTTLKKDFGADLSFYYTEEKKVKFVGYSWTDLASARKFKNYVNRIAREKVFTLADIN